MKKSISYLPKEKQEDLNYLVKAVLEKIPETQIIILFGSYARNEYVAYDESSLQSIVTKKDIDALVTNVELLRGITKWICEGKVFILLFSYYLLP